MSDDPMMDDLMAVQREKVRGNPPLMAGPMDMKTLSRMGMKSMMPSGQLPKLPRSHSKRYRRRGEVPPLKLPRTGGHGGH